MIQQDIQISDQSLREQYITYMKNGDYTSAFNLLSNTQLENKETIASVFNNITTELIRLHNQSDPTFKADRIQVASAPPSSLMSGQIYFQLN